MGDGSGNFFQVENKILDKHGAAMGPYGIAVYSALCRFSDKSGRAFPSHDKIASVTGMSRRQVMRVIDKLVDLKLIVKTTRRNNNMKQSNVYQIVDILSQSRCDSQSQRSDSQSQGVVTHSHNHSDSQSHKQYPINNTQEEQTAQPSSSLRRRVHDRLQQEWVTVNPTQLDGHMRLAERYSIDTWLDGFEATKPGARSSIAYVEKVVAGMWHEQPKPKPPKQKAYITDPVTGERKEVMA